MWPSIFWFAFLCDLPSPEFWSVYNIKDYTFPLFHSKVLLNCCLMKLWKLFFELWCFNVSNETMMNGWYTRSLIKWCKVKFVRWNLVEWLTTEPNYSKKSLILWKFVSRNRCLVFKTINLIRLRIFLEFGRTEKMTKTLWEITTDKRRPKEV